MNGQQEIAKNSKVRSIIKLLSADARQGIVGTLAFILFVLVFLVWPQELLHILYGFSGTEFPITGQIIGCATLAVLFLLVVLLYVFNLKRQEANKLRQETNELRNKLRKQAESNEALISAHGHLFTKYGLKIDSARFGLEASGAKTEDVTEQIVMGLAEKGKIHVGLHLVGGKANDPVENTPKKLYVDYIEGRSLSKEFDENYTLSIEDLVQNPKGNEAEGPRDFGPTGKTRWRL